MDFLGAPNASTVDVVVFGVLALATVVCAILTITRRNPVAAVMSLVATFFSLAGIYATLSAHFLAALQVMVYAGAIMVLFVFVVMILNRDEIEPLAWRGIITRALGTGAVGWGVLWSVRMVHASREVAVFAGPSAPLPEAFGTVASNGKVLFSQFVYPFEAISLLLLVAIVGGVIVSRSHAQEESAQEVADRKRAIRQLSRSAQYVGDEASSADVAPATDH